MKPKVVVADFISEPLDVERSVLGDTADVLALDAQSEEELRGRIEDADAILMYHFVSIRAETIARLKKCRLIVRCGVGVDNIDHAAARARNIAVANIPDYGTEDVADSAIGMTLSLCRGIHYLNSRLRGGAGPWSYTQGAPLHRVRGRVFGVVGLGRIGTAAALRAKALGMDVCYYDPHVPDGRDKALGVRCAERLEDLLEQAHVLSLHCPLTPETHHLIRRETLARMQPGSYLVNTARGAVAEVLAVLDALADGRLAGAGIDVLETEPPPDTHPLLVAWRDPAHPAHDRLILNPHAAFYSEEGLAEMRSKGCRNVRRVLLGKEPRNVVN